jgi:FkbH-like protein
MSRSNLEPGALLAAARSATSALDDPVLIQKLGRKVRRAVTDGEFPESRYRIAILGSFLTDMLADALAACLLARGVAAQIVSAPYGVIAADILSDQSITRGCDLAVILPTFRDLVHRPRPGCTREEADQAASREAANWEELWRQAGQIPIVQLSFGPAPNRVLADADGFQPGGFLRFIRDVNRRLADSAPNRVALVDAEALAARVGPDWNELPTYFLCKQPFGISALAEIANSLAAVTSATLGKARKVLVLDLDNTIWGGIVGDVGASGVIIGNESAEGEAYVAVQTLARDLAARGIILAVCSKNNEEIAREAFRINPGMVLREDDIACFIANFDDKATNLRRIAQRLNIGLDSLVFIDDNPVEREWVMRELPEVLVIDLPVDPAQYCAAIERAQAFPVTRITKEDLDRNRSYHNRAQVAQTQESAGNVLEFLRSLEPVIATEAVGPASLERIVQLIAKTNQFKLSPRIFTAEEIVVRASGVFAIRFRDRLQDYGIVAVVVTAIQNEELRILNWVMSCRVFSRRLEHETLEMLQMHARTHAVSMIRAPFVASAKNGVARDVMLELGFVVDKAGDFIMEVQKQSAPPADLIVNESIDPM